MSLFRLERGYKGVITASVLAVAMAGFYLYANSLNTSTINRSAYIGLTYDAPAISIEQSDIDNEMYLITQEIGIYTSVEAEAELGDQVIFDVYNEQDPSQAVLDQQTVLGSGEIPQLLENNLVGLKAGESATIDNVNQTSGEITVYIATMKEVKRLSELTDSLVQTLEIDNVTTVAELEQYVEQLLLQERLQASQTDAQKYIFKQARANIKVNEPDQALIDAYYNTLSQQLKMLAAQYTADSGNAVDLNDLLTMSMEADNFQGTPDEYLQMQAKTNATQYLAYQMIAQNEQIEVTDDEIYDAMAADWKAHQTQYPEFLDFINAVDKTQYYRNVLIGKVQQLIIDNATITINGKSYDEYLIQS